MIALTYTLCTGLTSAHVAVLRTLPKGSACTASLTMQGRGRHPHGSSMGDDRERLRQEQLRRAGFYESSTEPDGTGRSSYVGRGSPASDVATGGHALDGLDPEPERMPDPDYSRLERRSNEQLEAALLESKAREEASRRELAEALLRENALTRRLQDPEVPHSPQKNEALQRGEIALAGLLVEANAIQNVRFDVPVDFGPEAAQLLAASSQGISLVGEVPRAEHAKLAEADAVLIASALMSCMPPKSDQLRLSVINTATWTQGTLHVLVDGVAPQRLAQVTGDLLLMKAVALPPPSLLKLAGYTTSELRAVAISAQACKELGFTIAQMREAFTATELDPLGYSPSELRAGGYTAQACKEAHVSAKDAGFTAAEVRSEGFTVSECMTLGYTVTELKGGGYVAQEFKLAGVSAKDAGFTAAEVWGEGFTVSECKRMGFCAQELKDEECGFKAVELREGGFGVCELVDAGFPIPQLMTECEFEARELHDAGASALELLEAGAGTPQLLREAGCSAAEVKATGAFTRDQMESGGFSLRDATEMAESGFTCEEAFACGFSAAAAREAGYTLPQLLEAGYVEGLKEAGFGIVEVAATGFVKSLKEAGYTGEEAYAAGYSCSQFAAAGYSCTEARVAGYSCAEARAAGWTMVRQIKGAGYSWMDAKKAGYTGSATW